MCGGVDAASSQSGRSFKSQHFFGLWSTCRADSWLSAAQHGSRGIGRYSSVDVLATAIYDYRLQHTARLKPFVWTKSAKDILKVERGELDALNEIRGNR
jgi:hypothetical protein